ncbi:MAG TPA: Rieske 2Fe-2S domain-containing protein [Candidatus Binataceae bacterium]|nr:Rieske 2Fe-2S domain-containing protein [Candidatus Binataceae bacterium]
MNEAVSPARTNEARAEKLVCFPRPDGSRIPYKVFSSPEIYRLEQERIFRGPVWSFVGLEAEIPNPNDYKSSFVGDTPVVITRNEDQSLSAWVNRCAHRGAIVCRFARGNTKTHICAYHQWSFDTRGNLRGVPFRNGVKGSVGMPADFDLAQHGLQQLRVDSYRGAIFVTFSDQAPSLYDYLGPNMRPGFDRVFHKPVAYMGCTRQWVRANWKLYHENVRDNYHASLLHCFFSTFNLFRATTSRSEVLNGTYGLHNYTRLTHAPDTSGGAAYKQDGVSSFKEGLQLADPSVFTMKEELDGGNFQIQAIFPQLLLQQIQNSLVARQILPKGPDAFELVFHFFGYADDTPEMRAHRVKLANLVGAAGLISMEDGLATEMVQEGTAGSGEAMAVVDMCRDAIDDPQNASSISESYIRRFWRGYQELMGL